MYQPACYREHHKNHDGHHDDSEDDAEQFSYTEFRHSRRILCRAASPIRPQLSVATSTTGGRLYALLD